MYFCTCRLLLKAFQCISLLVDKNSHSLAPELDFLSDSMILRGRYVASLYLPVPWRSTRHSRGLGARALSVDNGLCYLGKKFIYFDKVIRFSTTGRRAMISRLLQEKDKLIYICSPPASRPQRSTSTHSIIKFYTTS